MCIEDDRKWVNCVLNNRGSFHITRRKNYAGHGQYPFVFEIKMTVTDTETHRLQNIARIIGHGRVTAHRFLGAGGSERVRYQYQGETAAIKSILEYCVFEDELRKKKMEIMKEFMETIKNGPSLPYADYVKRQKLYERMKALNKKSWCE